MKRLGSLTAAAPLGVVMMSSGPALAFDDQVTPSNSFSFPHDATNRCLVREKAGYPNPGGDGCSYLDVSPSASYSYMGHRDAVIRPA